MADEMNGRIQEIEKSLSAIESQLGEQIRRVQSGTRITLVIGIILIAFIFTYLTVLTSKLGEWMEPKNLAEAASGFATSYIPEIEANLKAKAPELIKSVGDQVISKVPEIRKTAEGKVNEVVDKVLAEFDAKADGLVDQVLKTHVKELKPLVEAAMVDVNKSGALGDSFKEALEEIIGPPLDDALRDYDRWMAVISLDLDRILAADDKTPSQDRLARDLIVLMMQYLDDFTKDPSMLLPVAPAPTPAPAPKAVPASTPPAGEKAPAAPATPPATAPAKPAAPK